jgi:hypothetical protein
VLEIIHTVIKYKNNKTSETMINSNSMAQAWESNDKKQRKTPEMTKANKTTTKGRPRN